MNIIKLIKDLISPKKCYSCNKEWHFLCEDCFKLLDNYEEFCYICKKHSKNYKIHQKCKNSNIYYDKVLVLTHYKNNLISKLIKNWKYFNKKDVFEDFWEYLSDLLINNIKNNNQDYIITSSPMYFYKKLLRWYNQADIIAKTISLKTWLKFEKNIIKKIKQTISQSTLNKSDREKNLNNVFKINKNFLKDIKWKNIIIVDDIISTWSTLNNIAKLLKQNWVNEIICLVIASD